MSAPADDPEDPDGDGQWRFGLDDVSEDGIIDDQQAEPIEPQDIELENVVFVLLGVVGTLLFLFSGL